MLGTAMFYGRGAGKLPTASAVVSDIIDAAKVPTFDDTFPVFETAADTNIVPFDTYSCKNMLVLSKMSEGKAEGIKGERSIHGDKLVLITDTLSEKVMKQVLAELGNDVISRIRLL
jgi:homoserine dehydrogenase